MNVHAGGCESRFEGMRRGAWQSRARAKVKPPEVEFKVRGERLLLKGIGEFVKSRRKDCIIG